MTRTLSPIGKLVGAVIITAVGLSLYGCNDASSVSTSTAPTSFTITSGSPLPTGFVGVSYTPLQLASVLGVGTVVWSVDPSSPQPLPTGLSLSSQGLISGTPNSATGGQVTVRIRAQDSSQPTPQVATKDFGITISLVPQPSITTSSLPNGVQNVAYSATLDAVGGTPPYTTWSVNPPLPTGLVFTPGGPTATISGTPTVTSNQTHTFSVTDSFSPTPQTGTRQLALTITAAPLPLSITTNSPLPPGTVTQAYGPVQLTATGGTPPLTWDLNPGSPALPNGLALSSTGVLSGTPSAATTVTPVFRVRDSATSPQQTATKPLAITISLPAPPNITTSSLPPGTFNVAYNQALTVSGGTPPFIWSFNGQLPPGLGLNTSTGAITGTPTSTGSFNFTPQVIDSTFQTDPTPPSLSITINPQAPPTITPFTLPNGTVNVAYPSTQLAATGGIQPYTWTVNPALPNGLSLSPGGLISGIPLAGSNGTTSHTFRVTDSTVPVGQFSELPRNLTINAALTIDTNSLPGGTVGTVYTAPALVASGGVPPYTWSITGTGAPNQAAPGITLSTAGAFSGTPTTVGAFTRTYRVQDNNGTAVTKNLTINVSAAALTITTPDPLPAGKVLSAYGAVGGVPTSPVTLAATGGTPPYTWSTTVTPPLPAGLSINAAGTISGTPQALTAGTTSHQFTVSDSTTTNTATKTLSLTIAP